VSDLNKKFTDAEAAASAQNPRPARSSTDPTQLPAFRLGLAGERLQPVSDASVPGETPSRPHMYWPDADPALVRQRERLYRRIEQGACAVRDRGAHTGTLSRANALELFLDQLRSRELDSAARVLRSRQLGYYTIQSAGHEQNAVLGQLLELDDPCLLHYRSGALMLARSRKGGVADPVSDVLASLCAARTDPVAAGRHKVWGSSSLWVPPQTSTIASHLPRATGLAFALGRLHAEPPEHWPEPPRPLARDAIVCCSFGDASAFHATALAGIHAARYSHRRGVRTPILFVCEDNGLGISVPTPRGWVSQSFGQLPHLHYVEAKGDLEQVHAQAARAIALCRESGAPVLLHLRCVRLFGHAGSDVEAAYRERSEIAAEARLDPLITNAGWLLDSSLATSEELADLVERAHREVARSLERASELRGLESRAEIEAPLAPYDPEVARLTNTRAQASTSSRSRSFVHGLPEDADAPSRRTLGAHLGSALHDAMLGDPHIWVFGEDVGRKGGVYHVTSGLQAAFGGARVFDTLLDETSILGLALGAGLAGILPVPEIQYLAYLHNALDQLRGEACSLSYFSAGQFRNPMVVRVASFAYQRGFGGHFHNDDSIGALRDIPGLMLAAPARGDDGARLLRAAIAIARGSGRVICFLEPIALYHQKDLYADGDERWLFDYPAGQAPLWPGEVGLYGDADAELLIVTYANGVRMSLRAARVLAEEHGVRARVLDLRWLAPLPWKALEASFDQAKALLVADECRATAGGIADAVLAHFAERGTRKPLGSVRSADCYVPLGPAANHILLQEADIVARARDVVAALDGSRA